MKTVGKKLLSLLLVAMLLVSAVPFATMAAEEGGYKVDLKIMVDESFKKTVSVPASSEAEMLQWLNFDGLDIFEFLAEEGELDAYGDVELYSVVPNTPAEGATTLTLNVWLVSGGSGEGEGGGGIVDIGGGNDNSNTGSDDLLEAPELYIVVKTGSGDYRIKASFGDKYLEVLSAPARVDREFKGWYSSVLGRMVKTSDIIEEDDTVEAVWSTPTKHTITFIDERGTEPDVEYFKQVAYGSELGTLPTPADRDGYIFVGWKLDATGKYIDAKTIYNWQGDVVAYAQWKLESDTEGEPMGGTNQKDGKVYLEIYINGDTGTLKKRVDITSYAADDKITRAEVQSVVAKYITPKTGYTLSYIGLFDDPLWWEYKHDPETNGKEYIIVNRDGDDYIFVMVNNVKVVASDSTNPKTGDYVLSAAMTMMAVSGLAAAAVYVIGKKRRA